MNALQRLQETQETLQGVAARLRIDIAGLTLPEQAGVIATEAIKLHDELVNVRTALADMERQRDEALNRASALEDEYADSDGQWKDATGLLVGGDPDGVTPGHLRQHIQRADRTIAAWKRCAKKYRAMVRGYEEADTKPRGRVEAQSGGPCPMRDSGLPHVSRGGESWCFYCGKNGTKPRESADQGCDIITPGIDGCSACLDRLQALTARAEKAERENDRLGEVIGTFRLERDGERHRAEKAERELARFQRADVGERVAKITKSHEDSALRHTDFMADCGMEGLIALATAKLADEHRGELLSIVRQQAAEIERLRKNLTAVGAILGRGWEETHEQAALRVAMHGVFSRSAARIWKRAAKKLYAETGRNAEQWVKDQAQIADMQRCGRATANCLFESRAKVDSLHAHLSAIRERVEKMETFDYHTGFEELLPMADGDYLKRSEVLSALGVVKDSLTTERKPVCLHCNDTHRIGIRWCSRCPRPCVDKCHDGNGYCRQTPCPCDCHKVASEAKS